MQISHITDFVTLADRLDYSLAAQKLFTTEDDLIEAITQLEDELGIALFINNARGEMVLTDFGEIFLKGALNIEKQFEQTMSALNGAKGKPRRTLRIGYRYDAAHDEKPYISRALAKFAPTVSPVFEPLVHLTLRERLASGDIDAAIAIVVEDRLYDGFKTLTIDRDVYELVCPLDHPFAKLDSVSLEDIAKESLIIPGPQTMASMYTFFVNIFEEAGIEMVQSAYYDDVDDLAMRIEGGAGVSMVLSGRRSHFGERLAFVPISDPIPEARINLIWSEEAEKKIPGNWLEAFKALELK